MSIFQGENFFKCVALICCLWVGWALTGCSGSEQKQKDAYLIKVGDRIITVADFNKAFKIAKAAYSSDGIQQPDSIMKVRLRLVQQMAEEMILLERAKDLGIAVTDSEVEKASENIKADYPGNEFEKSLIEYAVPYPSWKEGLKKRLIMEKVVAKELGGRIDITPEDISKYSQAHLSNVSETPDKNTKETTEGAESKTPDPKATEKAGHDAIVKILRREKMENAYASWMEELKKKYIVEINKEELLKSGGISDK
ncbi:MAG: SurA N-terminal domain-containing protein [Desulfobacterales bacterium]